MTRLDAFRALLALPRETADDEKIGHVYRWPTPDETVKLLLWQPLVQLFRRVS